MDLSIAIEFILDIPYYWWKLKDDDRCFGYIIEEKIQYKGVNVLENWKEYIKIDEEYGEMGKEENQIAMRF